ncbi:hypothetical protein TNCV_3701601 [Trichonephila clavipes]|nr:hypothetical protein TNCV_3701601 [Trichonephila clavipes]
MVQNYMIVTKSPRVAEQCDVNIHSLEKSAYVIDRDIIDFFRNFQKHPCGHQFVDNDANSAVSPIFHHISLKRHYTWSWTRGRRVMSSSSSSTEDLSCKGADTRVKSVVAQSPHVGVK